MRGESNINFQVQEPLRMQEMYDDDDDDEEEEEEEKSKESKVCKPYSNCAVGFSPFPGEGQAQEAEEEEEEEQARAVGEGGS